MIRIANPLYDVVFKYLMEDKEAACLLLSEILGLTVVELEFLPQEYTVEIQRHSITVYRMDFSAKIKISKGNVRHVILEIQKAKFLTDILRFREYLGRQYANRTHVTEDKKGRKTPIPIISVYILGYNLDEVKSPVVKVSRQIKDLITGRILTCTEDFVESLTHDCYIVQTRRLQPPYRTPLEHVLSIFDQKAAIEEQHVLLVDDATYTEPYRRLWRWLDSEPGAEEVRRPWRGGAVWPE